MIDQGDKINATAICILVAKDRYVFATEGDPLDVPLIVERDPTDKAHNKRIDEALEKLKI